MWRPVEKAGQETRTCVLTCMGVIMRVMGHYGHVFFDFVKYDVRSGCDIQYCILWDTDGNARKDQRSNFSSSFDVCFSYINSAGSCGFFNCLATCFPDNAFQLSRLKFGCIERVVCRMAQWVKSFPAPANRPAQLFAEKTGWPLSPPPKNATGSKVGWTTRLMRGPFCFLPKNETLATLSFRSKRHFGK